MLRSLFIHKLLLGFMAVQQQGSSCQFIITVVPAFRFHEVCALCKNLMYLQSFCKCIYHHAFSIRRVKTQTAAFQSSAYTKFGSYAHRSALNKQTTKASRLVWILMICSRSRNICEYLCDEAIFSIHYFTIHTFCLYQ